MKPTHCRHRAHAARPSYGVELIASGTGTVVSPIASAPASSRRAGAVRAIGAIGYGRERRVDPAWGSAEPQTPISYSAWV